MSFLGNARTGRSFTVNEYEDEATGDLWVIRQGRNRDRYSPFKIVWAVTNDTQGDDWGEFYSEEEALDEIKRHVQPENLQDL